MAQKATLRKGVQPCWPLQGLLLTNLRLPCQRGLLVPLLRLGEERPQPLRRGARRVVLRRRCAILLRRMCESDRPLNILDPPDYGLDAMQP